MHLCVFHHFKLILNKAARPSLLHTKFVNASSCLSKAEALAAAIAAAEAEKARLVALEIQKAEAAVAAAAAAEAAKQAAIAEAAKQALVLAEAARATSNPALKEMFAAAAAAQTGAVVDATLANQFAAANLPTIDFSKVTYTQRPTGSSPSRSGRR
jgi:hypothetical protein